MHQGREVVHEMIDQSGPFTHHEALLTFAAERLSPLNRTPKLLDLRCGTGRTALAFADAGWKVTAVDCSPDFEDSWARIRQAHPQCQFIVDDYRPLLPRTERTFDLVVAFDDLAVELSEDKSLGLALGYALHSLRRGGLFIFQLERNSSWATDAIEAAMVAGFREAWRATVVDLGTPIDNGLAHLGSREIFVARA